MTAICDLRVDEVEEAEEESGSYTDEEGSENQALLPNGTGPILYRTISVCRCADLYSETSY